MDRGHGTTEQHPGAIWRDLRDEFMQLENQALAMSCTLSVYHEADPELKPTPEAQATFEKNARWATLFDPHGEVPEIVETWITKEGYSCLLKTQAVSADFLDRFRTLATRAWFALGAPKGAEPFRFWLQELIGSGLLVHRACKTSATACSQREREAVENAAKKSGLPLAGQPTPQPLTNREQKLWEVIQGGTTGLQYCREVDHAGIAPPRKGIWKEGPRNYEGAYKSSDQLRHWIQNEKSKIRRKAELTGALSS